MKNQLHHASDVQFKYIELVSDNLATLYCVGAENFLPLRFKCLNNTLLLMKIHIQYIPSKYKTKYVKEGDHKCRPYNPIKS